MTKPKDDKRQKQRPKRSTRRKGAKRPGIVESWEDFDETAMREYLAAVAEDLGGQLDALEEALRCEN
jgi:hypothetical protein